MNLNSVSSRGNGRADSGAATRLDDSLMCRRMLIALFSPFRLLVFLPDPPMITDMKNMPAHLGKTAILRCEAMAVPPAAFEWYRDDHRWDAATGGSQLFYFHVAHQLRSQKCCFWTLRVKQPDRRLLLVLLLIINQRRWESSGDQYFRSRLEKVVQELKSGSDGCCIDSQTYLVIVSLHQNNWLVKPKESIFECVDGC